jgi:hypothetical protein
MPDLTTEPIARHLARVRDQGRIKGSDPLFGIKGIKGSDPLILQAKAA